MNILLFGSIFRHVTLLVTEISCHDQNFWNIHHWGSIYLNFLLRNTVQDERDVYKNVLKITYVKKLDSKTEGEHIY